MTTGVIIGKHNKGKHLEEMMDGLTKLLNIGQVTDALKGKGIEICERS